MHYIFGAVKLAVVGNIQPERLYPGAHNNLTSGNSGCAKGSMIINTPGAQFGRRLSKEVLFKMAWIIHGANDINPGRQ
jgi:hypothetical protein